ncbi:rimP [Mucuna pruriens]|uniref:RimP n=1 Tax=Mucuna pruriens TaxID=157652 RepID=A0A371GIU1_MUCPR|nr:rimP [Mucuna pruriens]
MDLIKALRLSPCVCVSVIPSAPLIPITATGIRFCAPPHSTTIFSTYIRTNPLILVPRGKKKDSESDPILEPSIVHEVSLDDHDDEEADLLDEFEYDEEYEEEAGVPYAGDGGAGGGISLAGTSWDKKALAIAKEVTLSFHGDLRIYAFKTLVNSTIQVRIENLSNKSGSPSMEDIEAFSTTYRAKLDEAELAKSVPDNISLEVSSPGVERVVRIPDDLDRFKDRPMYVKYVIDDDSNNPSAEGDGVFKLESFDMETKSCTWGLADVKVNRQKAGKGRPLNKKQREWRLNTPFDSLRFVRGAAICWKPPLDGSKSIQMGRGIPLLGELAVAVY